MRTYRALRLLRSRTRLVLLDRCYGLPAVGLCSLDHLAKRAPLTGQMHQITLSVELEVTTGARVAGQ